MTPLNYISIYLTGLLIAALSLISCEKVGVDTFTEDLPRGPLQAGVESSAQRFEHWDLEHDENDSPLLVDINLDGEADFKFSGNYEWDVGCHWIDVWEYIVQPLTSNAWLVGHPVEFESTIDETLEWKNRAIALDYATEFMSISHCGWWTPNEIGYLALKVRSGEEITYAWLKMSAYFSSADFLNLGSRTFSVDEIN